MTSQTKRCCHCGSVYTYHPSGSFSNLNDARYCPECMEYVLKALKCISVKFKKKWISTEDYTREQLEAHRNQRSEGGTKAVVSRILPGLIKVETGEWQESICEYMSDPSRQGRCTYYLCAWFKGEKEEVKKEVWWDIEGSKIADDQWEENRQSFDPGVVFKEMLRQTSPVLPGPLVEPFRLQRRKEND